MNNNELKEIALSLRCLSMDAIQKANSGHPGLPLGLAELGALLYGKIINHNPKNPNYLNRDRVVLSAGHGSMWLYSLLHLSGYELSLDDIKQFRQLNSKTPGHPEYHHTKGIETTTGPLGAGFATAVGMALAERMMATKFNTSKQSIINNYTYTIMGDGCMMEGVTSEAASLAGNLKLNKLIAFYDSNKITIEGNTDITFTENVAKRYESYEWNVLECSAYDFDAIENNINKAKSGDKPTLIILKSIIAQGAPTLAGSHHAHGAPLGNDEIKAFRKANNIDENTDFYVSEVAKTALAKRAMEQEELAKKWQADFDVWARENPSLKDEFDTLFANENDLLKAYNPPVYNIGDKVATRVAGGKALNALAKASNKIIGGSADLSPSNNTTLIDMGDVSSKSFSGRNIHFGVREHAMGNIANGLTLYGFRAFCSTFLVFSDYMRPTIRLAALMNLPTIFVLTHDSIFVGEDGPTHEPIEHVESMRLIPNVVLLRPADAEETNFAYSYAFSQTKKPTIIALTRHNLDVFAKPANWQQDAKKGAYIALNADKNPDVVVFATGSEVTTAIKAASLTNKVVRVISVIDRTNLFTNPSFIEELAPSNVKRIAMEAGVSGEWYKLTPNVLSIHTFGMSGKADEVAKALGFTAEDLAKLF